MSVERELWRESFSRTDAPSFICPECKKGRLNIDLKSLVTEEPAYSKSAHSHEAWEPDWITERFMFFFRCSAPKCGEVVSVFGDTKIEQMIDDDGQWGYEQMLVPHGMFPAPPIMVIPDETPTPISGEILVAFDVFWSDLGASANRLRTSIELLMDDFKIPREGKDKNGKTRRLNIQDRVNAFKAVDKDHVKTLDALRIVGNLGTHEDGLQREVLLDAFEIYEDALAELYGKHKTKIDELKKKIIEKKGKY